MPDNLQDSKSRSTFASLLKGSPPPKEFGKVVEWSITAVLKTAVLRGTGGSNPSLSATERDEHTVHRAFFVFYKSTNYIGPVSENQVVNYAVSVIGSVAKNLFTQADSMMQTLSDSSLRCQ